MKKLLSLLSVLTISGAAVPTTIAASPYQKEETIKNSNNNYSQTNNLEKLNRSKRIPQNEYYGSGQHTFDINNLFPVKNITVVKPNGLGQRNNPPANFNIIHGLMQANYGVHNSVKDALNVGWSTRNSAQIYAISNTPFYGSFIVYY